MPEVRVIQPITIQAADKLRVAAYARVSSDSADQRNSFSAQVKYAISTEGFASWAQAGSASRNDASKAKMLLMQGFPPLLSDFV